MAGMSNSSSLTLCEESSSARQGIRTRIGSGFNRVSGSGSGSRRAKMTHNSRNFCLKFMFSSIGWLLLRAEGFFCNLEVLYGGLVIGKL
jgi:hypothetical protein